MSLGAHVKARREELNLSQRDAAERCGLSQTALRYIEEHPDADPGLSVVMGLAKGLRVPRADVLEWAGYPTGQEESPPLTARELDRAVEAVIEQLNEDVRVPARNAKELLASLLHLYRRDGAR